MPSENVSMILRGCGMSRVEIQSVDLPPIHEVPDSLVGFGVVGKTGIGKTVLLAQHLGNHVKRIVAQGDGTRTVLAPFNFAKWCHWPSVAEDIKDLSRSRDETQLWDLLDFIQATGMLYLDDLGQERIKGEDDLSKGYLRVILEERYRDGKPVFWSSNLDYEKLSDLYGSNITSRMVQAWPPLKLSGKDLRLHGGSK